jgi:hypothetical protein
MKNIFLFLFTLSLLFGHLFQNSAYAQENWISPQFYEQLKTTGAQGEVHGVSSVQGLFVWTYRNPQNFFQFKNFTMVSANEFVLNLMSGLRRHDKVWIKAEIINNNSPQEHLLILDLKVVTPYQPNPDVPAYEHSINLPEELTHQDRAYFLVHAVDTNRGILVAEYKDSIVPIFAGEVLSQFNLYRGDLVQINYKIMKYPESPVHLKLKNNIKEDIQVIQSIVEKHGANAEVTGSLILFPKSPQIIFNIFAVEELVEGSSRQYTIVNFEDPELFKQVRQKLQDAWDQNVSSVTVGRNKLVNTKIQVTVRGLYNIQSPNQANPQVLVNSVDDVVIKFIE